MPLKQKQSYERRAAARRYSESREGYGYRVGDASPYADERYVPERRYSDYRGGEAPGYVNERYAAEMRYAAQKRAEREANARRTEYRREYSRVQTPYEPRRSYSDSPRNYGAYTDYPPELYPDRRYAPAAPPIERPATRVSRPQTRKQQREAAKKKARARLKIIAAVGVVFLMCALMIYGQTAIFAKNREIEELNASLSEIVVTNEAIQSNIDRSIELGNLESFAKDRLGMVKPDSSQVFYIDMGAKDSVVKSSE